MSIEAPTNFEIIRYCNEYLATNNKINSFKFVFGTETLKKNTAAIWIMKHHESTEVQDNIKKIRDKMLRDINDKYHITFENMQLKLLKIYEEGISKKIDSLGNSVATNLSASVSAISEINKMSGFYSAQKIETELDITVTRKII